jgi:uncharacterized protein
VTALLVAVLASSFAGSLHCAAMCGPLATLAGAADPGAPRLAPHLAYGLGRLAAYLGLGVVAGALGAAVDLAGDLAAVGRLAMLVAGAAMLVWGGLALARALGWRRGGGGSAGATRPMLLAIRRRRPAVRGALVGLLTAALPCGWLYAFVVVAAGTGSPPGGAAVMAVFWLGGVPALLGAGLSLRALARRLGHRLPVLTAGLQIGVGVFALVARAPMLEPAPAAASTAVPGEPSCH